MAENRRGPIIGRGSSATVTLASSSTGELYAFKSAELSKSNLLQNEQSILSTLNCPQIITFLGFEVTHLHYNLFLEYAPGGSLSDHIKYHGGRLDEPAVQSCTSEILTGLSYLHSGGIVHCDIKPQNILIGSDGCTKIADFGCARRMGEASYQVKGHANVHGAGGGTRRGTGAGSGCVGTRVHSPSDVHWACPMDRD